MVYLKTIQHVEQITLLRQAAHVSPKKFCQILCVENSDVAARAIVIFPHVKKYVEKSGKAKQLPDNSTCNNITVTCANRVATTWKNLENLEKSGNLKKPGKTWKSQGISL